MAGVVDAVGVLGSEAECVDERVDGEEALQRRVGEHLLRDEHLGHLAVQDVLLDGARADEAEDVHLALLPDAPRALAGLLVDDGVPVGVEEHDAVGAGEVQAEAADARGEQRAVDARILVELVHQIVARDAGRGAVHADVAVLALRDGVLDDVQHHARLAEDEHLVPVGLPLLEQLHERRELRAAAKVDVVVGAEAQIRSSSGSFLLRFCFFGVIVIIIVVVLVIVIIDSSTKK